MEGILLQTLKNFNCNFKFHKIWKKWMITALWSQFYMMKSKAQNLCFRLLSAMFPCYYRKIIWSHSIDHCVLANCALLCTTPGTLLLPSFSLCKYCLMITTAGWTPDQTQGCRSQGVEGHGPSPHILTDQLTLYQPGEIMPPTLLLAPLDFQTFLGP